MTTCPSEELIYVENGNDKEMGKCILVILGGVRNKESAYPPQKLCTCLIT